MEQVKPAGDGRAVRHGPAAAPRSDRPRRLPASSARSAGAGWASSTRPCRSRSAGTSRSRSCPCTGGSAPTQIERFQLEARSAARLHHGNIVPVHGVGEHQGVHYYAMQFIQGHGLDADPRRPEEAPRPGDGAGGRRARTRGSLSAGPSESMTLAHSLATGSLLSMTVAGDVTDARPTPGAVRPRPARPREPARPVRRRRRHPDRDPHPGRQGAATSARWPGSGSRSPMPWPTPISRACCTAISSRPTSCSTRRARSG